MRRPFRYAFDPICLAAIALYALKRWAIPPNAFTSGYVNDLLCLPIFVPMSLWLQRRLGLRWDDSPPRLWEVAQHWAVFSVAFEVIVPRLPGFRSTADPWDVIAYAVGGALAWACWRRGANASRG